MIMQRSLGLTIGLAVSFIVSDAGIAFAADTPASPISRNASIYPDSAGRQSGTVDLSFTIDPTGHVTDAKVIGSSAPGVFDQTALATVAAWTYQPRLHDGQPVAQTDNKIRLDFEPPQVDAADLTTIIPLNPHYTVAAYRARQEGDVTLSFDVDALGQPQNIKVVNATNPGWFDDEAIESLSESLFQPTLINGVPQEVDGITTTMQFRLSTAKIVPTVLARISPDWPWDLRKQGIEGTGVVQLIVDPSGSVKAANILYSTPSSEFGKAVARAGLEWRFAAVDPDVASHMDLKFKLRINFRFLNAKYQRHYALKPNQWVKIGYTLSKTGHPIDIRLLGTSSPEVNWQAAMDQLHESIMEPQKVNGIPVDAPNLETTIEGPTAAEYADSDQR